MLVHNDLTFSSHELLSAPENCDPLIVAGQRFHGGIDSNGSYRSPRNDIRRHAIKTWKKHLINSFGNPLVHFPLEKGHKIYPNVTQMKYLLKHNVNESFIYRLSLLSMSEAALNTIRYAAVPNIGRFFVENIAGTATWHLEGGLLEAHSRDEAGYGNEGGHMQMWLTARDIAFNPPSKNNLDIQASQHVFDSLSAAGTTATEIQRRYETLQIVPEIDLGLEMLLHRLISLFMEETRGIALIAWAQSILSDGNVVAGDGQPGYLISCIRHDETLHIAYLRLVISEIREWTIITTNGDRIPGRRVIDRIFAQLNKRNVGRYTRVVETILKQLNSELEHDHRRRSILEEFHSLADDPHKYNV